MMEKDASWCPNCDVQYGHSKECKYYEPPPVTEEELVAVLNDAHVHSPHLLGLKDIARAILEKYEVRRK